jgi:hypothetical protein
MCIDQFKLGLNLCLTVGNGTSDSVRMGPVLWAAISRRDVSCEVLKMCPVRSLRCVL